jgi:DNA-binding response OmpR family regulator
MTKLLLAASEAPLRTGLALLLEQAGFEAITAASGPEALALFEASEPAALLLDLALVGMNGYEVCQRIRSHSSVPILLLAEQSDENTVVAGLQLGADDCISKPVRAHELLARTNAALRRPHLQRRPGLPQGQGFLTSGDLTLDLGARATFREGRRLFLKPRTFALLSHFVQHPRQVFSRDELLRRLWPITLAQTTRTVDVHVLWIRQQIEDDPRRPQRLRTLRKKGYRFDG